MYPLLNALIALQLSTDLMFKIVHALQDSMKHPKNVLNAKANARSVLILLVSAQNVILKEKETRFLIVLVN